MRERFLGIYTAATEGAISRRAVRDGMPPLEAPHRYGTF